MLSNPLYWTDINSIARLLLKKGATAGEYNNLEAAVYNGDPTLVELSIEKFDVGTDSLQSLLKKCLSVSIMELLVTKGVDLNHTEPDGTTALHVAARSGSLESVEYLLNYRADPNRKTHDGYTPLHWAAFCGHTEVVQFLVGHGAESAIQNHAGETALHTCLHHTCNDDIVLFLSSKRDLLDIIDDRRRTALHEAARRGYSTAIKILIDRGATVNLQDNEHWTPLQYAAAGGHEESIGHFPGHDPIPEKFGHEILLRAAHFRNAGCHEGSYTQPVTAQRSTT